jgi:hypothetical protein
VCCAGTFHTGSGSSPVGSVLAGSVSVQAAGCKLALNFCSVSAVHFTLALTVLQLALWLAVAVARLVQAVLCKLSAICNVCYAFHSGSGIVLLALFLLAVTVFKLSAGNYQPCVMPAMLFTGRGSTPVGAIQTGVSKVQTAGSQLLTICNAC